MAFFVIIDVKGMVTKMKLIEEKFTHSYNAGANAIAIDADDKKIKQYILEHANLHYLGTGLGDPGCDCGDGDFEQYEMLSIRNEVTPGDILNDEWITVTVDEELYAVHKPFLDIIYDGNMELIKEEIEENYDDFVGFTVVRCPKCKIWAVCD